MYYKYQANSSVIEAVSSLDGFQFQITEIRQNALFIIGGCYFKIIKNKNRSYGESDSLVISYYTENKDSRLAKEKIQQAIRFFVFLTGIPYEDNVDIEESKVDLLPTNNIILSGSAAKKLQKVEYEYQRIGKKKRRLLNNALKLYSKATQLNFLFDVENADDAFFVFFKIIEMIVQNDFDIEKNNIDKGRDYTEKYVKTILSKSYGIKNSTKYEELVGEICNRLFNSVFENIYHKIIWFARRNKIAIDEKMISKVVSIRNDIAHGTYISLKTYEDEYIYIMKLTSEVICAKFFSNEFKIKTCIK